MSNQLRPSLVKRCIETISLATLSIVVCATASAQSAFVRVNQIGYGSGQTKRAYLLSSGSETGATFTVKNSSGVTVFSGPIGANLGSWSRTYGNVYALDFNSVTAVGTYTITVSGPLAASSPMFRIDTPANLYSPALVNSLFYYQTQRDGPNFIATRCVRPPLT